MELEPVKRYFDAWNSHDSGAIAACFDPGGGYSDPVAGHLQGPGIATYASGLFDAFPDLRFEMRVTTADGPCVVARWTMTGTQSGPFNGLPPTDERITLDGIDVITLGERGLRCVEGFFDQRTLLEQLGVQIAVQPADSGPMAFGTAARFRTANTDVPRALGLTWIDVRSEAEREEVRQRSRSIVGEMAQQPGFIGWIGIVIAERLYTLTLWNDPENVRQLVANGRHRAAARRVFATDFGAAAHTGVWVPDHLNPRWERCASCGAVIDPDHADRSCSCGVRSRPRAYL